MTPTCTGCAKPFGAAYAAAGGISENDNAEVRRFTTSLDEVKQTAGVRALVMPVHTGRADQAEGQERGRGGTVIDDWPDVIMYLTKDNEDHRYLRTDGRAPYKLPESRLGFDAASGRLMLATEDLGINRKRAREQARIATVIKVVSDQPGLTSRDLRDALGAAGLTNNEHKDDAIHRAKEDRVIHTHPGKGNAKLHYRGPTHDGVDCPEGWTL